MCDSVGGDVRRFLESDKAVDFVDQVGAGLEHGQKVEDGKFLLRRDRWRDLQPCDFR